MIFNLLFKAISGFLEFIFGLLPSLPKMPDDIIQLFNNFLNFLSQGVGLVKWLLSPALFGAVIFIMLTLINFDYIFKITLWIARKLPIGVK